MHITFIDLDSSWRKMLPLSYTRPLAELRVGILKIREKWQYELNSETYSFRSMSYLHDLFPAPESKCLTILGNVLPSDSLVQVLRSLNENEVVIYGEHVIAGYYAPDEPFEIQGRTIKSIDELSQVHYPWDLFRQNGEQIKEDYARITAGRTSEDVDDANTRIYGDQLFLEEDVNIKAATLNTENGPIYLGKGSEIQEGALIRGPFALGEHSVVNMGAKIRGDTTVGLHSKVGGEVSNCVFQGYSNKGHDGFLGNAVIGEWCNLGADTNNSNLKNNYANVKMWDFESGRFKDTGLQFCGLIMGDHSKCGINTMFNTGTTVGVSANIFGEGFPRTIIPSFAWGGASGFSTYMPRKVFETAEIVMKRRGIELTEADKAMLSHIFEMTSENRVWERK